VSTDHDAQFRNASIENSRTALALNRTVMSPLFQYIAAATSSSLSRWVGNHTNKGIDAPVSTLKHRREWLPTRAARKGGFFVHTITGCARDFPSRSGQD
jgi:hypothetical protein